MACLQVLSFNIKSDNTPEVEKVNEWKHRSESVCSFLKRSKSSIICLQDVSSNQIGDLSNELLPKYSCVHACAETGGRVPELNSVANPIFFLSQHFRLCGTDVFWLGNKSRSSSTPHKCLRCSKYRICSWVKLQRFDTKDKFYVFNTHLCRKECQSDSLKTLREQIRRISFHRPFLILGDFGLETFQMEELTRSGFSNHAKNVANVTNLFDRDGLELFSYPGFTDVHRTKNGGFGSNIDHFLLSPEFTVDSYRICTSSTGNGQSLSDHRALFATLYLPLILNPSTEIQIQRNGLVFAIDAESEVVVGLPQGAGKAEMYPLMGIGPGVVIFQFRSIKGQRPAVAPSSVNAKKCKFGSCFSREADCFAMWVTGNETMQSSHLLHIHNGTSRDYPEMRIVFEY